MIYLRMHLKRLLGVFARVGSRGLRRSRRQTKRCQASALQRRALQMSKLQRCPEPEGPTPKANAFCPSREGIFKADHENDCGMCAQF
jgi:hypothetical protein